MTTVEITQTTSPASGSTAPLGHENRRAFPRRRAKGDATLRPSNVASISGVAATIVDISHAGIRILAKQSCAVGESIELELTPKYTHGTLNCSAEVRWNQTTPDGKCYIGCAFRHRLNFEELQRFL